MIRLARRLILRYRWRRMARRDLALIERAQQPVPHRVEVRVRPAGAIPRPPSPAPRSEQP